MSIRQGTLSPVKKKLEVSVRLRAWKIFLSGLSEQPANYQPERQPGPTHHVSYI